MTITPAIPHARGRRIRAAAAPDRDALYDICLRTGASGADATGLYRYPSLLGDVFVGPYLALQPDLAFVVAGADGAEGYVLGAADSAAFAERCLELWWPERRRDYSAARPEPGGRDAWLLQWIASPPGVPQFADEFPSHLHIDLLPSAQGGGWGRRLIATLVDALRTRGSIGVHLGVAGDNANAIGFYRHLGFEEIESEGGTMWMGQRLR